MMAITWIGIALCLSQSALLSGINLGLFPLSKLELEVLSRKGDPRAPRFILRADDFIREALFAPERFNPHRHCHRPIVVRDPKYKLGDLLGRFHVRPGRADDDILDDDVILLWGERPRVLSGTDILGRLLRGIARK